MVNEAWAFAICNPKIMRMLGLEAHIEVPFDVTWLRLRDLANISFQCLPKSLPHCLMIVS